VEQNATLQSEKTQPHSADVVGRSATRGLDVVFDPALDGGTWPRLGHQGATCGEAWLGPLGLLARFELELGVRVGSAPPLDRELELARMLEGRAGPWQRSFDADPIATAKRMLGDRDLLALWGWRGEPASERLAALWVATLGTCPGVPDRLRAVIDHLARRKVDIGAIRVMEPIAAQPPLWRQFFAALERFGVHVTESSVTDVLAAGDLAAVRTPGCTPTGDGSVQLVRPHGVLAAAEEVAATLASSGDLQGVVIVGPDAILDNALVRHGLPRVGAEVEAAGSSALVRLCIEAAFQPMDAADLHALLCADPGPVPRTIARRLTSALGRLPGRGSSPWREALAAGLDAIANPDEGDNNEDIARAGEARRRAVEARLAALLDPITERTAPLSIHALTSRLGVLVDWARGRVGSEPRLRDVIALGERLVAAVNLYGADPIERTVLRRLCAEVEAPLVGGARAEVGLASVAQPGAVIGPARTIVWWGFTRDRAPVVPRVRLSANERAALMSAGVTPPDAGIMIAHEARRWRRPLQLASQAIVFVSPCTDETGESAHLHPLWDELIGGMADPSLATRLHVTQIALPDGDSRVIARRERAEMRPLPIPMTAASARRSIALQQVESASSIEQLIGCSLAYALRYTGRLWPGMSVGAADTTPVLYGQLAHVVMADVFAHGALDPDAAATRAAAVFDAELPRLAETMMLPDHHGARAMVRQAVVSSARAVAEIVAQTGGTIRGVELLIEGAIGVARVQGRADLVLADPDQVIDFKWGQSTSRDKLKAGAAIQLAIYAELVRTGVALPGAAYLILRNQRLLAARGAALTDASVPTTHSTEDMLGATRDALAARASELAAGQLVAPSAVEDAPASRLSNGALRVAPACGYCDLGSICGRRGRA
jgi:RecB family exonuclease